MNTANQILLEQIQTLLTSYGSALIAYSGGVDSTLLAAVARQTPGLKMLAVLSQSPSLPASERDAAIRTAKELGIPLRIHTSTEFSDPQFLANPHDRCYYCKKNIFSHFIETAKQEGLAYVLDGSNADDASDYRPGALAIKELGIRSPFRELGITKAQIRELSAALGLPTANKPAMPCLATRIPYGSRITLEKIKMIEAAEEFIHSLGLQVIRVRHHEVSTGALARLETGSAELVQLCAEPSLFKQIADKLLEIGYAHVRLDMQGYRMGSLHESFEKVSKK